VFAERCCERKNGCRRGEGEGSRGLQEEAAGTQGGTLFRIVIVNIRPNRKITVIVLMQVDARLRELRGQLKDLQNQFDKSENDLKVTP
jgi:hypothetical protein